MTFFSLANVRMNVNRRLKYWRLYNIYKLTMRLYMFKVLVRMKVTATDRFSHTSEKKKHNPLWF